MQGTGGCGNFSYDVQNRLTGSGPGAGSDNYVYDTRNKRVAVLRLSGEETIYFYGARGEKLTTMVLPVLQSDTSAWNNVYFGGRLVERNDTLIGVDRLGSVGSPSNYLPYGEEVTTTANGMEKFATYTRDNATGFDYADQRFYNSIYGRFMTPDPYRASGGPGDPGSWNRYSYVQNDPANHTDHSGQMIDACEAGAGDCDMNDFFENTANGGGDQYTFCKAPIGGASNFTATYCPVIPVVIALAPPDPGASSSSQLPCAQDLKHAFGLDYSQLLYKNKTQSSGDHILERHGNTGIPGVSQYFSPFLSTIMNVNWFTYYFGTESVQGGSIVFTYLLPQITAGGNDIGTDATGQHTAVNKLVIKLDCKTVITSYPIPGID